MGGASAWDRVHWISNLKKIFLTWRPFPKEAISNSDQWKEREDQFIACTQAEIQVPGLKKNIFHPNCQGNPNYHMKWGAWAAIWSPNDQAAKMLEYSAVLKEAVDGKNSLAVW